MSSYARSDIGLLESPTTTRCKTSSRRSTPLDECRILSTVLREECLNKEDKDEKVKIIEVPFIKEVIKHVPKKVVIEVEKRVPVPCISYMEKIVEVPEIRYIEKHVEVEQKREIIREVKKRTVVDVPKEVIRQVPVISHKYIERTVEVPKIVEVPKKYRVENKVHVNHYTDKAVPVVIAQSAQPYIHDTLDVVDIDVLEYEPEIIQVDVQVPKPVCAQVWTGSSLEFHKVITVPDNQYNSLLKALNPQIKDVEQTILPYKRDITNRVQTLDPSVKLQFVELSPDVKLYGMNGTTVVMSNDNESAVDLSPKLSTERERLSTVSSSSASSSSTDSESKHGRRPLTHQGSKSSIELKKSQTARSTDRREGSTESPSAKASSAPRRRNESERSRPVDGTIRTYTEGSAAKSSSRHVEMTKRRTGCKC